MKKNVKHLLSALIFTGFIIIAFGSGDDKKTDKESKKVGAEDSTSTSTEETNDKKSNWNYEEQVDKMEGTKEYYATCTSTNEVDFEFPYSGGSSLNIIVRNLGKSNEAILTISKGQFMGSIADSEAFKVKFDEAKPETFYYDSSSDGSSDVVFITNSTKFISKIKKAKKVMIEMPFFDAGTKVFEFNVEGLNWNK